MVASHPPIETQPGLGEACFRQLVWGVLWLPPESSPERIDRVLGAAVHSDTESCPRPSFQDDAFQYDFQPWFRLVRFVRSDRMLGSLNQSIHILADSIPSRQQKDKCTLAEEQAVYG